MRTLGERGDSKKQTKMAKAGRLNVMQQWAGSATMNDRFGKSYNKAT
jgi:hypothetical protein